MMAASRAQKAGHDFDQVAEATILAAKKRVKAYKENDTQTLLEIDRLDRAEDLSDLELNKIEQAIEKKDIKKNAKALLEL